MHQARPKCAERHHKDECRHQVHQRDGFDLRHSEARRHGQNAAAGGQVRKHGGGQHTGQQFAHSEHKEQDDHLGQRDSADGCPSVEAKIMAVKPSSTALDISSEESPVMPSVRVLYQPKPLQQNRATAEMESAHQIVEELAGPLFQMQAVADGEAHQDGQHHGRHAGCLDDGIDADGDGTEPEQGGQVIFQPAIKPVIDLSLSFVLPVCTFLHGLLQ